MELYRYFSDFYLDTLSERRLMFALPSSLNDPFEFAYRKSGRMTWEKGKEEFQRKKNDPLFYEKALREVPEVRDKLSFHRWLKRHKKAIIKSMNELYNTQSSFSIFDSEFPMQMADRAFRICCFSDTEVEPLDEILLWSHYAAKHTGIRIKFDIPSENTTKYMFKEVIYSKERVSLDMTDGSHQPSVGTAMIDSLSTKAIAWAYEKEFRILYPASATLQQTGKDGVSRNFVPFPPNAVKGVDFGLKTSSDKIQMVTQLLGESMPHVRIRKAFMHPSNFSLIYKDLSGSTRQQQKAARDDEKI